MRCEDAEAGEPDSENPWEPWLSDLERVSAPEADGDAGALERLRFILENLYRFPFHEPRAREPEPRNRLFAALLDLYGHADDEIRDLADHYAWIVIGQERVPALAAQRIARLLPVLEPRIARDEVMLLRCVDQLVHVEGLADLDPQPTVLAWLERRAASPELAMAARIAYLDGRVDTAADSPEGNSLPDPIAGIDHSDGRVRAYAARALGQRYADSAYESLPGVPPLREFVRTLTAKEIERPGIAGPFFSNWYDFALDAFAERAGVDVRDWLIDLLARRQHPEPDTLPCSNGIDFFAHELFGGSPEYVRRLLELGHEGLAVEAATEVDQAIDGLLPLLVELAEREDPEVCRLAAWHLAGAYRHLHPAAAARGFVERGSLAGAAAEVFLLSTTSERGERHAYRAVLFPTGPEPFDESQAATTLERILPQSVRGALVPFGLPGDEGKPGLWIHGTAAHARYTSGALVQFDGDVEARRWQRIQVLWHGTPGAWRPALT